MAADENLSGPQLYGISLYFVITTVTTVGYGDITPSNGIERTFCYINMTIGIIAFSFASGSLSSIMSSYDANEADFNQKLLLIQKLKKQYNFSDELESELNSAVRYEFTKAFVSVERLISAIPLKLQ